MVRLNREKAPEGLQCSGGFNAQGVVPLSEPSGQKHHTSGNKRKITHRYDRHLAESLAGEVFEARGISERVLPFALELLPLILQLRGYTTSTHTHTHPMLNTAITTKCCACEGSGYCFMMSAVCGISLECVRACTDPDLARAFGPQLACGFSWKRVR